MNYIFQKIRKKLFRRFSSLIDQDRFKTALGPLLRSKSCPIVIDVGAHHGETIELFKSTFGGLKMYCFEPFPDSFNNLKITASKYSDVEVYCCGLSNVIGEDEFNSNIGSPTNSLLELDEQAISTWDNSSLASKNKIKCKFVTLDSFIEDQGLVSIDLLKIDVQGAEYRVLEGAEKSFKKGLINLIFMEIIIGPTYKNQKDLADYLAILDGYGFALMGFYNLTYDKSGSVIQLDALFKRRS